MFNNAAQVWNHTFFWNSHEAQWRRLAERRCRGGDHSRLRRPRQVQGASSRPRPSASSAAVGRGSSADGGKLKITATPNAVDPLAEGQTALLTCDVWEHAYYLDYQNRRPDFVQTFLDHLINWDFVAQNSVEGSLKLCGEAPSRRASLKDGPPIQQHRGVLSVGHAERLSPGQAGERNLARRRAPRSRVSLAPAEGAPVGSGIERGSAIMPDACRGEGSGSVVARHRPDTTASRGFLPMPDLVVRVAQIGNRIAADGLNARDHISGMESPVRRVLGDVMDLDAFVDQASGVARQRAAAASAPSRRMTDPSNPAR